jgi:hypothetical protein
MFLQSLLSACLHRAEGLRALRTQQFCALREYHGLPHEIAQPARRRTVHAA